MSASGNIRTSQIRSGDKTGTGSRLATAASGTLAQNVPLLYDANGNVVATATRTGNTTNYATAVVGAKTSGNYPKWDANGNLTDGDTGGGGVGVTLTPPVNGSFSDLNSPSVTATSDYVFIKNATTTGNDNWKGRIISIPSAPWTLDVAFQPCYLPGVNRVSSIGLYDGTKLKVFSYQFNAATGLYRLQIDRFDSVTAWNSTAFTGGANIELSGPCFLRIVDDNTNWTYYWGIDFDLDMSQVYQETRNQFLTPTHLGMFVNNTATDNFSSAKYVHWRTY